MRAMLLRRAPGRLECAVVPDPKPAPGQVVIRVAACAVCRTDLHIVDGELAHPKRDLVPGHEIVGRVAEVGPGVTRLRVGDRVGVPWLGWTCGACRFCQSGRENLCAEALFTGYQLDGGYAEYAVADSRFCLPIPEGYADVETAPLICAGLIGHRALRMAGTARRIGLYGFGAAAHIIVQVAQHEGREVFAFTRPGDRAGQDFARRLGAAWAGGSDEVPPALLEAAIIFAPHGALVPAALGAVEAGGSVVCAGIHMSDIPAFPYALLWQERVLRSVANLTRADGEAFLNLAPRIPIRAETHVMPLTEANAALYQVSVRLTHEGASPTRPGSDSRCGATEPCHGSAASPSS
ncbi:zinc-dependent alcohol dehydrogenase family protein [Sabulicella rubraurantiaca]|uniref:zinc-dependent alcohol dehydrogenase family protein n=1 Tax=Sabulicella rubraurantiaca TaxID=2811429 RepID=UPI001A966FE1